MSDSQPEFARVATMDDLETLDQDEVVCGYMEFDPNDPEPGLNRGRAYWHGWSNAARDAGLLPQTSEAKKLAREWVTSGGRRSRG